MEEVMIDKSKELIDCFVDSFKECDTKIKAIEYDDKLIISNVEDVYKTAKKKFSSMQNESFKKYGKEAVKCMVDYDLDLSEVDEIYNKYLMTNSKSSVLYIHCPSEGKGKIETHTIVICENPCELKNYMWALVDTRGYFPHNHEYTNLDISLDNKYTYSREIIPAPRYSVQNTINQIRHNIDRYLEGKNIVEESEMQD